MAIVGSLDSSCNPQKQLQQVITKMINKKEKRTNNLYFS